MKTWVAHRPRLKHGGTALVAGVLVAGYFTLIIGGNNCQYLLNNVDQHHSSSNSVNDIMHCLMDMHGTMAAAFSSESAGFNPLQFLTSVVSPDLGLTGSVEVIADTIRAPPSGSTID